MNTNTTTLCVFDMAGTTINDGGRVYDALREAVEETGASVAEADLQTWMGTDKVQAITELMRLGGQEPAEDRAERAFDRFREILAASYESHPPRAIDGAERTFRLLHDHGIRVALTTGFDDQVATPLIRSLGWDDGRIDAVVTTDDVAAGRPAPYMIHRAMERTGVHDVATVLAAGDTEVDVQAARNAGAISVGVLTGGADRERLQAQPHDHILDGVGDIPALLGLEA